MLCSQRISTPLLFVSSIYLTLSNSPSVLPPSLPSVAYSYPLSYSLCAARNYLNRLSLSADYAQLLSTLHSVPCSSGFSLNVGQLDNLAVTNLEVWPGGISVFKVSGYNYHFNMYADKQWPCLAILLYCTLKDWTLHHCRAFKQGSLILLLVLIASFDRYMHSDPEQYDDPSSDHRLARVKQLPPATDAANILSTLGDTWDHQYPIYRTAVPPDSAATITTGMY